MTTRAQLESERHELRMLLGNTRGADKARYGALTASIARVEALLSLSDEAAEAVVAALDDASSSADRAQACEEDEAGWVRANGPDVEMRAFAVRCDNRARRWRVARDACRTVANLIRREPRGDV